eukprot:1132316-Rhodomonas_salina.1
MTPSAPTTTRTSRSLDSELLNVWDHHAKSFSTGFLEARFSRPADDDVMSSLFMRITEGCLGGERRVWRAPRRVRDVAG